MVSSLDAKVLTLKHDYANADSDTLRELLLVCGESLTKTRMVLDESFERTVGSKHGLYQSSITSMCQPSKKKLKPEHKTIHKPLSDSVHSVPRQSSRAKIVYIYNEQQAKEHLHPYASLHKNFLPHDMAEGLLRSLLETKDRFTPKEFYLFDKLCKSDHGAAMIYLDELAKQCFYYNGEKAENYKSDKTLKDAADCISTYINNEIIPKYPKLPFQLDEYRANACVVNYFEKLSSKLDWHSDRLQHIGPHCFVGSISLGSTREFRLRRHSDPSTIYSIPLPHNSLLIMHPGCQELFKHTVNPMTKPLQINSLAGTTRFNLTFRYFPPDFVKTVPKCKCDIPMILRRSYKTPNESNFGKYYWSCENVYQNKDCKTFHWADFSNVEGHFVSKDEESASTWAFK